jgi:hypothetical protein
VVEARFLTAFLLAVAFLVAFLPVVEACFFTAFLGVFCSFRGS